MPKSRQPHLGMLIILLLCLLDISLGCCDGTVPSMGAGAVGMCYVLSATTQVAGPRGREKRPSPAVRRTPTR